jgi:signal transduction histidine kinase
MISLGRLAAGLAHELNNPASVTVSAARMLVREIVGADSSARALGTLGLSVEQIREIERVREICLANPVSTSNSLAERVEREEAIRQWLERTGADPDHAAPLADTPVTVETLDVLATAIEGPALDVCLEWISTGCATRSLAMDIERAAGRIHDLVSAVKRFSFMDRASGPELVDLRDGLEDTVAIMRSKARSKSATITLDFEPELPQVLAAGAELNQIWFNLIDNALDSIPESGQVEISAGKELDHVVVRIVDDGHGIPPGLIGKIFDPFFTTKEPGKGTGLGLDIARSIARRHSGEILVESRPGRTEFRVRLPSA